MSNIGSAGRILPPNSVLSREPLLFEICLREVWPSRGTWQQYKRPKTAQLYCSLELDRLSRNSWNSPIAAEIAARWTRFTVGAIGLVISLGLIARAVYDMWVQAPSKLIYTSALQQKTC
jgi:hypothetical protein